MMKIDEFIEKVNRNDRMEAEEVDGVITIYNDSDHEVIDIPNGATNLLEIDFIESYSRYNFGKPSREYLSALIEEFLHTPINERFSENKYTIQTLYDDEGSYLVETSDNNYYFGCLAMKDGYGDKVTFTSDEIKSLKNNKRIAIDWNKALITPWVNNE